MKMKQFFIFAVNEIKKFKKLFDYIKNYKYIEFFKEQIYLFFKPITELFRKQKEDRTFLEPIALPQEEFEIVRYKLIEILREEVKLKIEIKEDSSGFSNITTTQFPMTYDNFRTTPHMIVDREKKSPDRMICTFQANVEALSLLGHNAMLVNKMKVAALHS